MSVRAESHIKFSTYFNEEPPISVIRELHDKIIAHILDVFEDMEMKHSHITVECPVGYTFATFYGIEDDEVYDLDEEEPDPDESP